MKDVVLRIEGIQKDETGEENVIELMTEGKFYEKRNAIYIVYKETELSGMDGCTTTLKLTKGKISMKRFGTSTSEMIFERGKRHAANYSTPYGNFDMEVLTKNMIYTISDANKGNVFIEYEVRLQGMFGSNNSLNIQIM
jgi:uncharacterized beta-barrel protein YwiB (DUF1934 family)